MTPRYSEAPPVAGALRVAIAAENDDYDGAILRRLLELALGEAVDPWASEMRFSGLWSVATQADPFLHSARAGGVKHALFAVDNDGGARRRPEHSPGHDAAQQAADPDGCRWCWLDRHVPAWWREGGRLQCVVVPVQTIETWLLHLRGDVLPAPSPEQFYSRQVLKRALFGRAKPPLARRVELALELLARPDALERLRGRPSFRLVEVQLQGWRRE